MKISPIRFNSIYKSNLNKKPQSQAFNTQEKPAFLGLKEVSLKTQGLFLQIQANKAQNESTKILAEAHKIQERKDEILLKAQVYYALAQEALEESLPTIRTTRNIDEKWNFSNLPPCLKSKTARPIRDGVHISEVRHDNTSRQIFVRDGQIAIHEFDEYEQVKTTYNFNLRTLELNFILKGLKQSANYQITDERYRFENGEFVTFDEYHLVNNEATYEKGLTRFDFEGEELIEYKYDFEAIDELQQKSTQVFCFDNGILYEYGESIINDLISESAKSTKRVMYEPNEKLAFYILKDKDMDNLMSNYSKIYEFQDDAIKSISLGSIGNEKMSISRKVFDFENGKLKTCALVQKMTGDTIENEKSITF